MNLRLADVRDMTGVGAAVAAVFCVVVVLIAALLAAVSLAVPSPAVIVARNASAVFAWAVVTVMMSLLAVSFYTEYLLLKGALDR